MTLPLQSLPETVCAARTLPRQLATGTQRPEGSDAWRLGSWKDLICSAWQLNISFFSSCGLRLRLPLGLTLDAVGRSWFDFRLSCLTTPNLFTQVEFQACAHTFLDPRRVPRSAPNMVVVKKTNLESGILDGTWTNLGA